ncbi:DNA cytosine methyltransferase [Nocardioides sp. zg-1230]|nr:DNA cytosine methyltransferase [Nocardioides sp. zg-1230]
MSIKYIDAFAGAGGLSLGLHQLGFESLLAFDTDPLACRTLSENLGGTVVNAPLAAFEPADVVREYGMPDVIVGGPPCQGFSTQRRGERNDARNDLVLDFFAFALEVGPSIIVMENVPGVLGERGKRHMSDVFALLGARGYVVDHRVLDASRFGLPQRRRRAIIVAWNPQQAKPFDFDSLGEAESVRTVRDAIGDLPSPPSDFSEHPAIPNHAQARMSELNVRRISFVPPGGGRLDIPVELQMACHRDSSHRHLDVFGRLSWDEPSGTITAMFDNFTRGRFAHPSENRNITNREGARLQSFPDSYKFVGPKKDVARQIGNAVPPLLARAIGRGIAAQLGVCVEDLIQNSTSGGFQSGQCRPRAFG